MKNRNPDEVVALLAAVAFLVVAILGFVPGITTRFSELGFAGHQSEALLLGLFQISVLHNLVHALFGIVGLIAAKTVSGARGFLLGAGVTYLVLTVFGALIDLDSPLNFVPLNVADNWLHLALGLGMLAAGLALGKASPQPAAARATSGRAS